MAGARSRYRKPSCSSVQPISTCIEGIRTLLGRSEPARSLVARERVGKRCKWGLSRPSTEVPAQASSRMQQSSQSATLDSEQDRNFR